MGLYRKLLLGNRQYRYVWLGAVSSYLGDWFNLIASAELLSNLSNSGIAISYLFLARFLPSFIVGPYCGVLADRYDRKKLMVSADILRAFVVLGFLFVRSSQQIWLLYLLTILQFILSSLFVPAKTAVIATVVPKEDLVTANALDSTTWSVMLALGSLLGGVIAGVFGTTTAFIADSLTFLLSAWFISKLTIKQPSDTRSASQDAGSFSEGLRYLFGAPVLFSVVMVKAAGSAVWGAINVLEIDFANEIFPIRESGALTLGIIYAATAVGTGSGPILMRKLIPEDEWGLRRGILIAFAFVSMGIFFLSRAPALLIYLIATFLRGFGSGTLWVFSTVYLQKVVMDKVRGRVFAFELAMLTFTQSLSTVWAGWAQDTMGMSLRDITFFMSILGLVVFGIWGCMLKLLPKEPI